MERLRKYLIIVFAAAAFAAGGSFGWMAMKHLVTGYLHGGRLYILAAAPGSDVLAILNASAGRDEAKRAAAWYTLAEFRFADPDTVIEAYKLETAVHMKKLMLFVLKQCSPGQWQSFIKTLPDNEQPVKNSGKRTAVSLTL